MASQLLKAPSTLDLAILARVALHQDRERPIGIAAVISAMQPNAAREAAVNLHARGMLRTPAGSDGRLLRGLCVMTDEGMAALNRERTAGFAIAKSERPTGNTKIERRAWTAQHNQSLRWLAKMEKEDPQVFQRLSDSPDGVDDELISGDASESDEDDLDLDDEDSIEDDLDLDDDDDDDDDAVLEDEDLGLGEEATRDPSTGRFASKGTKT